MRQAPYRQAPYRQAFSRQAVARPVALARHAGKDLAGKAGVGLLPLLALSAACLDGAALHAGGQLLKALFSFR